MNKKIILICALFIIVISGIILYPNLYPKNTIIIKGSVAMGDLVQDKREPAEACGFLIPEKDPRYNVSSCRLINSKRLETGNDSLDDCVDGASVAGCFACTFECAPLP